MDTNTTSSLEEFGRKAIIPGGMFLLIDDTNSPACHYEFKKIFPQEENKVFIIFGRSTFAVPKGTLRRSFFDFNSLYKSINIPYLMGDE